jgi:small nuclear ribonucleoprotein (snRNP)-like protein
MKCTNESVTVELKNGAIIHGTIASVSPQMNTNLRAAKMVRLKQLATCFDEILIRENRHPRAARKSVSTRSAYEEVRSGRFYYQTASRSTLCLWTTSLSRRTRRGKRQIAALAVVVAGVDREGGVEGVVGAEVSRLLLGRMTRKDHESVTATRRNERTRLQANAPENASVSHLLAFGGARET